MRYQDCKKLQLDWIFGLINQSYIWASLNGVRLAEINGKCLQTLALSVSHENKSDSIFLSEVDI